MLGGKSVVVVTDRGGNLGTEFKNLAQLASNSAETGPLSSAYRVRDYGTTGLAVWRTLAILTLSVSTLSCLPH